MTEFQAFQKIPRLSREVIVTEKIDGTNGCIYIGEDGEFLVGSRNRWITPEDDNFGFAAWAYANKDELLALGPGRHYGEWWGSGIQRGYGMKNGERCFSLFNVSRWNEDTPPPACCRVVPVLWAGTFSDAAAHACLDALVDFGSHAVPGYMNPEGIVIYHTAAKCYFKKTIKDDSEPKSKATP